MSSYLGVGGSGGGKEKSSYAMLPAQKAAKDAADAGEKTLICVLTAVIETRDQFSERQSRRIEFRRRRRQFD